MSRKKTLVAVAILAAVLIGGGLVYAQFTSGERNRQKNPEKYVVEGITKTLAAQANPYDTSWIYEIMNNSHLSELTISPKELDLPAEYQQQLMYLQMAGLKLTNLRDGDKMEIDAGISVGGVKLLDAELYMADDEFALRLPQGQDYFMTLNPKAAVSQWDNSSLSELLGVELLPIIGDNTFYDSYMQFFTNAVKTENPLRQRGSLLLDGAVYEYIEKQEDTYVYAVTLKPESLNQWYNFFIDDLISSENAKYLDADINVLRNFALAADINMVVYETEGVIRRAEISTELPSDRSLKLNVDFKDTETPLTDIYAEAEIINSGDGTVETLNLKLNNNYSFAAQGEIFVRGDVQLEFGDDSFAIDWDYSWDREASNLNNFNALAKCSGEIDGEAIEIKVVMTGNVLEGSDKQSIMAKLDEMSLYIQGPGGEEIGVVLDVNYNVSSAPGKEPSFDRDSAVALDELTPLHLMGMYTSFMSDPIIGGILEEAFQ